MAFAASRNARTISFTAVGTSPSVGGGRDGPLRGLPPGIDCAGKAGARKRCLAPIIARWPSLPRGARAPTPSLPSARRPQSEGAATAPSEASPQESTAQATRALASAVWLPSSLDGLRFLAERAHQLLHCGRHVALDDAPGRPGRQRFQRDDAELRGFGGDPEVGGLEILDLLLLGAHDPFERRIARLVQALLGREHRRQREIENLQAALDLARDADALAVDVDRFLHDPGGAGPAEQVGELSRDRAHVVVDRLAPAEDELGRLLLGDRGQRPRGGEGVGLGQGRIVHVDGAVAAHGQTRAQCLLGPLRAQGDGDHLGLSALFLDAQRLLHGELVVRGHDPGDPGGVDRPRVGTDLHLRRRVRHLFDGHQDLHAEAPSKWSCRVIRNRSPGMKTRSQTTARPPTANETRSDSKAGAPTAQPSSRASRRPRRTAETLSRARTMTSPILNSSAWRRGVAARSALTSSSPMGAGRKERCRLMGRPSTSRSRSICSARARGPISSAALTRRSPATKRLDSRRVLTGSPWALTSPTNRRGWRQSWSLDRTATQ